MASRKKTKKKVNRNFKRPPLLSDDVKRIIRITIGVSFAVIVVWCSVALISYAFDWKVDQSLLSEASSLTDMEVAAQNEGGKVGNVWSDLLIGRLFGIGAYLVPLFLTAVIVYCFRLRKVHLFRVFLICAFGCVIFSVLAAFLSNEFGLLSLFAQGGGGSYGHYAAKWLVLMLGTSGAGLLIFLALFIWLVFLTPKVAFWLDDTLKKIFAPRPKKVVEETDADEEMEDVEDEEFEDSNPEAGEEFDVEEEDIPLEVEEDEKKGEDWNPVYDEVEEDQHEFLTAQAGVVAPVVSPSAEDVPLDIVDENADPLANLDAETKEHLYNPRLDFPKYEFPSTEMLEDYRQLWYEVSREEHEKNKVKIVNALASYKIKVVSIAATKGPTVTLYRIKPAEGTRIAQVKRLEEDIAMSLGAKGVRVLVLEDSIGIEVANEKASVVPLKMVLNSPEYQEACRKMELPVAMGITVTNKPFFFDLAKMPHLLIAGATGMGKSVGLNALIASLLYGRHPAEMKFVMVDPKKVELDFYNHLEKHFLAMIPDSEEPIITDTQKVIYTLKSLCIEMDARYDLLRMAEVRKITEYNDKFLKRKLNPLKGHKYLPYIVVIIDEFADLICTAGREIETPIARLAQKARAVGIHLVIATQRPTTDVITGTIKANFNSRVAFRVNSTIDSKTILDQTGANRLIGRGDMLVIGTGIDLTRVQCALIDTEEVERLTKFIGAQRGDDHAMFLPEVEEEGEEGNVGAVDLNKRDRLFNEAAQIVVQNQQGSTSLLQRKLGIGYNKAGRIIDQLEAAGVVGAFNGSKARPVLITDLDALDRLLESLN